MSRALSIIAALISIGAGIYMLGHHSAANTPTVFDILLHGIGAYFIGKGLYMGVSGVQQTSSAESLARLSPPPQDQHGFLDSGPTPPPPPD
jgi:multisubunit Na+/H+ antiporter MnhC subunit